jgi:penicillin-binding protein 2
VGADGVFQRRARLLHGLLALTIGLFVGRLYLLQVIRGEKYREGSQANSEKRVRIEAPRGLIFDREGRLLVGNRRSYDLVIDRERVKEPERVANWVAQVTGETPEEILVRLKAKGEPAHRPLTLARDLTFSQVAYVEARQEDVPGLTIETRILREYPNGSLAAHVLGYVGEIDQAELKTPQFAHHESRDQVGKGGVERSYDDLLSGRPGTRQVVVDNIGRMISTSITEEPEPGAHVYLSLDLDVQRACEDGLEGRRGACIMLDTRTGAVRAIASAPTYDPNAFVGGISSVRWKEFRDDPHNPLSFRAIAGTYPPGSVWKALVSAAAIQSGKHRASTTVTCTGAISMWGRVRHCWKEEGHGTVAMRNALIQSCNVYYYTAGRDMGPEPMWELGHDIGFGKMTGIDVPGERAGIMPDDKWVQLTGKTKDQRRWWQGDTVNMSIGQGYLSVTPMQVAVFGMTIANGGDVHQPTVFERAVDPGTQQVLRTAQVKTSGHVPYSEATLHFLHDALLGVVDHGTATRAKVKGILVAGKTGTAQPSSGEAPKGIPREQRAERYQEHAWFMGYAPADNPEVAFAIVLEHSGLHGGEGAAPIARGILEAYFADRLAVAGQ